MSDMAENMLEPGSPEYKHYIKVKNRYNFMKMAAKVAIALALGLILLSNYYQLAGVRRSSTILVDCTTPGHKCYEQGRSATSGAVGTINKVTIVAIACSKIPSYDTIQEIQDCVKQNLPK